MNYKAQYRNVRASCSGQHGGPIVHTELGFRRRGGQILHVNLQLAKRLPAVHLSKHSSKVDMAKTETAVDKNHMRELPCLIASPYCPDLAPSDLNISRSVQTFFCEKALPLLVCQFKQA